MRFCRLARGVALMVSAALVGRGAVAQTTVTFNGTSSVDLGTNLDKLADLDPWSYTLGTEWDEDFTIGGIIGAPNTTIIPEIKILGAVIIPEVKADTRTGARLQGRVYGETGLEFSADFVASGLEPGVGFNFAPTLTHDTTPAAGSFFKFNTTTGVQNNPAFTEAALELPSVSAEVDFFFNAGINSSVDYGLFPFVPYNSVPFVNLDINLDQRNDPNKSLVRFDASFDPDSNGGAPLPPTLTFLDGVELFGIPLETQVGLLDDGQFLANKQISFNIEDKNNPNAPRPRIDVGEVQVLNPFGTGGDLLGGNTDRNLKVGTTVADDAIGYTAETPLFRLGLDLDGLATGLVFGHSFTRIEEELKIDDFTVASIVADLIDLKYGPELGFRESVEINPDFDVTLTFRDGNGDPVSVAINDNGSVTLMSSFQGNWADLPEIALLTADPVDVEVTFDALTGQQSKRGAFYLSDYLEFTLLELESLNILDLIDISLPPVFRTRTSLLGNLLGQVELEAYSDSQAITPFGLGGALPTQSFTITPAPSVLAYLTSGGAFDPQSTGVKVRKLEGDTLVTANGLPAVTLVVGLGDTSSQSVADFTPLSVTDNGAYTDANTLLEEAGLPADAVTDTHYDDPRRVTGSWGLHIIAGSNYEQSGNRVWRLPTVRNDGFYHGNGEMTTFQNPGGTMFISGDGVIEIEQHARLAATVIIHGEGHTLRFDTATGYGLAQGPIGEIIVDDGGSSGPRSEFVRLPDVVVDAPRFIDAANIFINAGTLDFAGSRGEVYAGMRFENTAAGRIDIAGDGNLASAEDLAFTTPEFMNNGVVNVGPDVIVNSVHPNSNLAQDLRGDGTIRIDGGTMHFGTNVSAYAPDTAPFNEAASQTFEVVNGGKLAFQGNTIFYAKPTFNVGVGSELTFNGLVLDGASGSLSKFGPGAPIDVVNDGHLIFNSGSNSFKLSLNVTNEPSGDPIIIPIGLENNGTVTIRNTARLTLDAEIQDYAQGGATFDAGTWEIIGPTPTAAEGLYNNLTSNDSNVARFNLNVDRVQVGQNYLSVIDPGQPGGFPDGFTEDYSATGYDTFMSVNKSDITLSGRAKFAYLNTVETNHGTLTFDNRNSFTTAGALTNSGVINITNGSRLDVQGDLIVDGGTLFGDGSASITVNGNTIEVVGGTFFFDRTEPTLFVNSDWVVRERVEIDNNGNVTAVIPSIVDYGNAVFPTIGPNADITVAGVTAEYRPLRGLSNNQGKLTLDAGNALTLEQNLTNTGELSVLGGANLFVNADFTQSGEFTVGEDSYAFVAGTFTTAGGSTTHVDGVIEAALLELAANSEVTGSGRLSGGIDNDGNLEPGDSPGIFRIFGDYTQGAIGTLTVELLGSDAGEHHDQLLADTADLAGELVLESIPELATTAYGKRLDIVLTDNGISGHFDTVTGLEIDANHAFALFYEPDRVSVVAALKGDANFSGRVEQGDLDAVLSNWGDTDTDWLGGDLNGNGSVEQGDLDAVLGGWGLDDIFWMTGDLNASGLVEQGDLDAVLANWGLSDRVWFGAGDLNGNGIVEQGDLDIILGNWGSAAAPDFRGLDVPEPTGLIVLLGCALTRRPRSHRA